MVSKPTISLPNATILGAHIPPSPTCPKPIQTFKRIPYAKAPRFKPPMPLPLSGTIDASISQSASFPNPMGGKTDIPEDVLTLNVIRPAPSQKGTGTETGTDTGVGSDKKLPVVVYLHGGAFNFGSPADADARHWVGQSQLDIIVVAVAYRLGVLGFPSGQEEGNLGLRDQGVAREWVNENIGAFNGDRENVVLLGVSAGGHSLGHHMLNPHSSLPLPKRVILESASPTARSILSPSHPRIKSQTASFHRLLPNSTSAPLEKVLDASIRVWGQNMGGLTWPFQPTIQGPLSDLPLLSWRKCEQAPDVLTGFCRTEGRTFINKSHLPFRKFWEGFIPNLPLDELEAAYPSREFGSEVERLYTSYGDWGYKCPVLHTAHMVSRKGGRVFVYEYAGEDGEGGTSGHCAHAPIVRGPPPRKEGLKRVSEEMKRRWEGFITGDVREWPVFETPFSSSGAGDAAGGGGVDGGKGEILVFGEGNDEAAGGVKSGTAVKTRALSEREKRVCEFWWGVMEVSEGMGERGVVGHPY